MSQPIRLQPAPCPPPPRYPGPDAALRASGPALWRLFESARARRQQQVAAFVASFVAAHRAWPTAAHVAAGVHPPFHTEAAAAAYLAALDPCRPGCSPTEPASSPAGDGRALNETKGGHPHLSPPCAPWGSP